MNARRSRRALTDFTESAYNDTIGLQKERRVGGSGDRSTVHVAVTMTT
jgi:hypothetical protein